MSIRARSLSLRLRSAGKRAAYAVIGRVAVAALRLARHIEVERLTNFAARLMRAIGPWLPEHRIGRDNLVAAFPEKSPAEIDEILLGVWENLGRVGAEFAHLDRLWDCDPANLRQGRIELAPGSLERFIRLREQGRPALVFTAHLANWELPSVAAATLGIEAAIIYRRPNIGDIDRAIHRIRNVNMGVLIPTAPDAPHRAANALQSGVHVGLLADQYYVRGVDVTFFGRRTKANPLLARLLRHVDCPIHGVRMIRLPGHRFRGELTEEIAPVRDQAGNIDIAGTMQAITDVIEGWVREYPDQWLWLHRRWR